jgi:hypothetical protein
MRYNSDDRRELLILILLSSENIAVIRASDPCRSELDFGFGTFRGGVALVLRLLCIF